LTDIRWSRHALRDYRNIIEWLEERSPAAAQRVGQAISARLARLRTMPRIGRIGRVAGTRELVVLRTPYIIVYRIENDGNTIGIARVLHSAQKWPH
jgi:addiction module RelE/StbE family toxin